MSKGYIVIAQNNDTTDYLEQAYALALNLKLTQSTVSNLTVCVDSKTKKQVKAKHKEVFDNIVDIPWQDDAKDEEWKINNKMDQNFKLCVHLKKPFKRRKCYLRLN